jgi:hypothetical protein
MEPDQGSYLFQRTTRSPVVAKNSFRGGFLAYRSRKLRLGAYRIHALDSRLTVGSRWVNVATVIALLQAVVGTLGSAFRATGSRGRREGVRSATVQ